MNTALKLAAATISCTAATLSLADGARSEKNMTLALANQLAAAAVSACQANGYAVTASVVDRAGGIRAMHRADNAGPHTIAASERKAYTSASAKNATTAMMETAQKNPGAANLANIPGFLLLGGGMPVKVGNEVIAAVGVGGAPGGHLDDQCVVAAMETVKDQLK